MFPTIDLILALALARVWCDGLVICFFFSFYIVLFPLFYFDTCVQCSKRRSSSLVINLNVLTDSISFDALRCTCRNRSSNEYLMYP